ncbi:hypothetical protein [Actinoplanes derwentensis]|uniref:Uncharacterized protein n=1 Tax=Actinoplanes derwentensis TaxID=113562 RepID=A0A1H2D573_9ACTN|nr:hypothetical protein [Actinoplanes derwentensis]GID87936.1 hypothetical protein Ade03nite_68600 [Actinoplanes derwentensis]SDT77642.1 hypothetical protein SAMN04489716_8043 [Actinoplanes derwentensis]
MPDEDDMQSLVVRLRTIEQERDAWRARCDGLTGERDEERATARRLRGSGSYRLGRGLVTLARDPMWLMRRARRAVPPRRATVKRPLPARLYVAIGLDLPTLREFVQTVRRLVLVVPDHRAVVLTDNPEFSLLRKAGLILEYLPDRQTWERHRPDHPWDVVLSERLSRLYTEHGATRVSFVDPEKPPTLPQMLDTTPPVRESLQQS